MVLRDSLGGNCLTAMIATISLEAVNLGESLSTCRFAQRVACIANNARRNEEVDDKSMIKRLKARIADLEAELALLKFGGKIAAKLPDGVEVNTVLTDEDKLKCASVVRKFVAGVIADPLLEGITDLYQFRECMQLLKDLIASSKDGSATRPISSGNLSVISSATSGFVDESDVSKQRPVTTESIQSVSQEVDIQMATPATTNMNTSDTYGWTGGSLDVDWSSDQPPSTQPKPKRRVVYTSTPEFRFGSHKAREAFKTPFEKKKERDVKKLNDKVEKMYANQLEEQQHLVEFQTSVKEQQLELIEKELQASVDRCREQLADQHAYVLSLKRNKADQDLIDQEKLVERQLRKREHKLHKRLNAISDQKEAIQKEYQQQEVPSSTSPRRDVHEKFSEFTKSGGKLNVRQVKQILQGQEREQHQYQKKIERQRIMAVSKQLEVKEMSTRQKLMEFKEKLRMSQSGSSPATSLFGNLSNSRPATTDDKWVSNGHVSVIDSFATHSTEMHVEDIENGPVYSPTSAMMNHEKTGNHSSLAEMDQPGFPASTSISSKDLFEKSLSDRLDSNKNRNQEGSSNLESNSVPYTSPLFKALHGDKIPKEFKSKQEHKGMERGVKKSSIFVKGPRPSKRHTNQHETNGFTGSNDLMRNRGEKSWKDNSVSNNSFGKVSTKDKIKKNDDEDLLGQYKNDVKKRSPRHKENTVYGRLLDDDDLLQQFVYEGKHHKKPKETSSKGNSKHLTGNSEVERGHSSGDKIRPSEYVSKSANGNFDARKMGLSANTFDSALSNMLGEQNVGVSPEFYDQYARPQNDSRSRDEKNNSELLVKQLSKSRSSYDAKKFRIEINGPREVTRTSTKGKASHRLSSENDNTQPESLTKPDTKGSDSKEKASPREFIVPKKSFFKLQNEKTITEENKSSQREFVVPKKSLFFKPQSGGSPNEEVDKPVKITATKESQREETYMSTALQQKDRVLKIRQAIRAAEVIQRAWHRFKARKK